MKTIGLIISLSILSFVYFLTNGNTNSDIALILLAMVIFISIFFYLILEFLWGIFFKQSDIIATKHHAKINEGNVYIYDNIDITKNPDLEYLFRKK